MSLDYNLEVPQMVGFEVLTKIIIAYSKIGGDKEEKPYSDVAKIANVSPTNVRINGKFLTSMGILEGSRGSYKLTLQGAKYARALDWGKLNEANTLLREILQQTEIVKRIIAFVGINKPVEKEILVSQIAMIAEVTKTSRFETGIRGFVDMLTTSGLLEETDGKYNVGKSIEKKPVQADATLGELESLSNDIKLIELKKWKRLTKLNETQELPKFKKKTSFPVTLNININDKTNVENLKKILQLIKEIFSE